MPWGRYSTDKPSFEDWVAGLAGLANPSDGVSDFKEWHRVPANQEQMSAFWDAKKLAVDNCPITQIVHVNSDGHTIVAVNGSVTSAYWGAPKEPIMAVDENAVEAAKVFCVQNGIPFDEPKWLLVAYSDMDS